MRVIGIVGSATVLALVLAGGVQAQGRGHERGNEQPRYARPPASARANQAAIIAAQRARDEQYRATLSREEAAAQQRAAQLEVERRRGELLAQQQYLNRLRAQQRALEARRDYERMEGLYAPPAYRYRRGGVYYQTSTYGADVLRQAVRYGYEEGYRHGQADRDDGRAFDYRDDFAYQDANYGYTGLYVPEADYNYYFRQGFLRGYQDGFYARQQYGLLSGGVPTILGTVLSAILSLAAIR